MATMKKYIATIYRSNPQFTKGGYETTRTIEATNIRSASKKANEICDSCIYGSMTLLDITEAKA